MTRDEIRSLMSAIGYRFVRPEERSNPTPEAVADFERKLGFELPASYKNFLLDFGITGCDNGSWKWLDEAGEVDGAVDVFYGISPRAIIYNLEREQESFLPEDLPRHLLPIASSTGGQIVLSLAEPRGAIYWWHQEEPFGGDTTQFIARDFDTFLIRLVAEGRDGSFHRG